MSVKVLFFARLADQLGKRQATVDWQPDLTIADVWQQISGNILPTEQLLTACNQTYCSFDAPVEDGDEIAFFPPVTGG